MPRRILEGTELGVKPKRSNASVIVTGEEKGLLGSRYFARNPTIPEKGIVADINTDMFLPLYPLETFDGLWFGGIDTRR
jgi:Zn-dependent M28 family amino/carboxypeptidase